MWFLRRRVTFQMIDCLSLFSESSPRDFEGSFCETSSEPDTFLFILDRAYATYAATFLVANHALKPAARLG